MNHLRTALLLICLCLASSPTWGLGGGVIERGQDRMATTAEMQAGTSTTPVRLTAALVKDAIDALSGAASGDLTVYGAAWNDSDLMPTQNTVYDYLHLIDTDDDGDVDTIDATLWATKQAADATLTDIADGTILEDLVNTANPWAVNEGGTGAATLTDHGILLGSGTSPVTPLGAATDGQIPIGSTGADPVLANITETGDAITVTPGPGTIDLAAHSRVEALADGAMDPDDIAGDTVDDNLIDQAVIAGFGPTADPVFSMLDINAPGAEVADKDSGGLQSQYVDGAEDAENSDVWIYVMQGGSRVNFMHFDESDDAIKPLRDINSAYTIQGRAKPFEYAADQTLTEAVHGGSVVMMTVAGEVTMWDCTATNNGSFVTLWPRDAEKIEVVPASGDQFYLLDGTGIGVDDELDMAAEAGKKVTFMCWAENEWRVYSEMAAATDGGAAD